MDIVNLFKDHWVEILALLGAIDLALGIVSKWTPFVWDDNVYAILHSYVSRLTGGKK